MFVNEDVSDIDSNSDDNILCVCSTKLDKVLKRLTNFIRSYCTNYWELFHMVCYMHLMLTFKDRNLVFKFYIYYYLFIIAT